MKIGKWTIIEAIAGIVMFIASVKGEDDIRKEAVEDYKKSIEMERKEEKDS